MDRLSRLLNIGVSGQALGPRVTMPRPASPWLRAPVSPVWSLGKPSFSLLSTWYRGHRGPCEGDRGATVLSDAHSSHARHDPHLPRPLQGVRRLQVFLVGAHPGVTLLWPRRPFPDVPCSTATERHSGVPLLSASCPSG